MNIKILSIIFTLSLLVSCQTDKYNTELVNQDIIDSLQLEIQSLINVNKRQLSIISKKSDIKEYFNNIEIAYNLPDYLHPKLFIYSDLTKTKLIDSFETDKFLKPSKWLIKANEEKKGRIPRRSIKKVVDIIKLGSYYILTAAELQMEDASYDVLIWKKTDNFVRLVSHYPEFLGCLYCGVKTDVKNDTIIFNMGGEDAGDIHGGTRYYLLQNDSLEIVKEISFNGYNSDGIKRIITKTIHYKNGNIAQKVMDVNYEKNGEEQYVFAIDSTINLLTYDPDRMQLPLPFSKTITVKNDPLKYAYFSRNLSLIRWDNKWYLVKNSELNFKKM